MSLQDDLILTADVLAPEARTFLDHLDERWIHEAFDATGVATLRRRRLPVEQVVWLVLGMCLMRGRSISDVVDKLDLALPGSGGAMASSAISKARQRVGSQPIEWLFRRASSHWSLPSADRHRWRDLRLLGVDGTKFFTPDTASNNEEFYKHPGMNGCSGFPMARVVAVMVLRSGLCVDAEMGSYAVHELDMARPLFERLPDDSLTIVDRAYFNAPMLLPLGEAGTNRYWLTRTRKNTRWEVKEQLGDGDQIVELKISRKTRQSHPNLPETWLARVIHWRDGTDGKSKYLATSLFDAQRYPAEELRALYCERWDHEVSYDDLKTEQLDARPVLRSQTAEGIRQEIWGALLAYNLVRVEMETIADRAGVPPRRVSFLQALRLICDEWMWLADTRSPGAIPKHLKRLRENLSRLILPPRRKRPTQPRALKKSATKYPSKTTASKRARRA